MTTRQPPPLNRANAEAILTGTATERSELAQIIAAARGPATSDELAGEAAAMIRFRAGRLEPAGRARRDRAQADARQVARCEVGDCRGARCCRDRWGGSRRRCSHPDSSPRTTRCPPAHRSPRRVTTAPPRPGQPRRPYRRRRRQVTPRPPQLRPPRPAAPLAPLGVSFAVAAWPVHRISCQRDHRWEADGQPRLWRPRDRCRR